MNTNITKTWTIEISEDEVFARCTNESLYQAYKRTTDNPSGDDMVLEDDDRVMFSVYFANAINNLRMMLARRMDDNIMNGCMDCGIVSFALQMHDNHDVNILPILIHHCYDYLVKNILEQWYKVNMGSELARLEVLHCLHYRKHPVRRRVTPL